MYPEGEFQGTADEFERTGEHVMAIDHSTRHRTGAGLSSHATLERALRHAVTGEV